MEVVRLWDLDFSEVAIQSRQKVLPKCQAFFVILMPLQRSTAPVTVSWKAVGAYEQQ